MKHHHVNYSYIAILLVVLGLYAGCTSTSSSSNPSNYRTGSEGLYMQFLPDNMRTVYDGDEAVLLLELGNRGTSNIEGGQLFASGFDPLYLPFQFEPDSFFTLEGKSAAYPRGDLTEIYTLRASRVRSPPNRERFEQPIMVTACYDYVTVATAEVCVNTDASNRMLTQQVCEGGARGYGAQGHPVTVTSVNPVYTRDKVRMEIRFANSGRGEVYNPRLSTDDCGVGLRYDEIDRVVVSKVTLGGRSMSCSPQNPVRLSGGSGYIVCECDSYCLDNSIGSYWTALEVHLRYGYRQSVSTQITILNN